MNGPIASGKDTVSKALAGQLERENRRVALIGLDELWLMLEHQEPRKGDVESWLTARRGAAALTDLFFDSGRDVVIVNGPFFTQLERNAYLEHLRTPVEPLFVTLRASFEESFRRAQTDRYPRRSSRNRAWLAERYAASQALLPALAATDLILDTDHRSPGDVAAEIRKALERGADPRAW